MTLWPVFLFFTVSRFTHASQVDPVFSSETDALFLFAHFYIKSSRWTYDFFLIFLLNLLRFRVYEPQPLTASSCSPQESKPIVCLFSSRKLLLVWIISIDIQTEF